MNEEMNQDPFERLKNSDPLFDPVALRKKVEQKRKRKPAALSILAASALTISAVGVGFGVYGLNSAGSHSPTPANELALPHAADAPAGNGFKGGVENSSTPSGDMGRQAAAETAAHYDIYPGYGNGRTVFELGKDLSDKATTSPVYAVDTTGITKDRVTDIANVFGLKAKVTQTDGYFSVQKGSAYIWVNTLGDGSFSYYSGDASVYDIGCYGEESPGGDAADAEEGGGVDAVEGVDPAVAEPAVEDIAVAPPGDHAGCKAPAAPSEKDAKKQAEAYMKGLGFNLDDYDLKVTDYWTSHVDGKDIVLSRQVLATHKKHVDLLSWNFVFTGAGLESAYGIVGDLVSLGDYKVISPRDAVNRLSDTRFGSPNFYSMREPYMDSATMENKASATVAAPRVPDKGSAIKFPVTTAVIEKAELTHNRHYGYNGDAMLVVPVYRLSTAEGLTWEVLAVDESHLDMTPVSR